MDVYDFDGTLYRGDSTTDFVKWCIKRHPAVVSTLPLTGLAAIACFGAHAIDKTRFKAVLYRFLPRIPDVEGELERFWRVHEHNISGPCHARPGDLVISASPEFLLRDVCARRGLELMASQVDPHTGRVLGRNCSGAEKIVRLQERYPGVIVEHFYSDSHNDDPLAKIAREAFMVNIPKSTLIPWPY